MKSMNPEIKDNPAWGPYLSAVMASVGNRPINLEGFLACHPKRLRPVVALALSVAKWCILLGGPSGVTRGSRNCCGCCEEWYQSGDDGLSICTGCPLMRLTSADCVFHDDPNGEVYSRILKIYTEQFNALPEEDKQRLA